MIGYHYVVKRDGKVEAGRPVDRIPAAVKGHNAGSLAVCWIGTREPTKVQTDALISLVANLAVKYKINIENIKGHREYPNVNKDCPNIPGSILRLAVANKIGKTSQGRPMATIAFQLQKGKSSGTSASFLDRFFRFFGSIFNRNS